MLPQPAGLYAVDREYRIIYQVVGWDPESRCPYVVALNRSDRAPRAVTVAPSAKVTYHETYDRADLALEGIAVS